MHKVRCASLTARNKLQVVSELLARHVLLNYDKFVEGITEIGLVEDDLQVTEDSASKRTHIHCSAEVRMTHA